MVVLFKNPGGWLDFCDTGLALRFGRRLPQFLTPPEKGGGSRGEASPQRLGISRIVSFLRGPGS